MDGVILGAKVAFNAAAGGVCLIGAYVWFRDAIRAMQIVDNWQEAVRENAGSGE